MKCLICDTETGGETTLFCSIACYVKSHKRQEEIQIQMDDEAEEE